jgi:D-alanyl-D-alanine carboxypeptidase (penicillin-binding protein 5/6)
LRKANFGNVSTNILLDEKISAPIEKGQKLGEINFMIDNNIVGSSNLIAASGVKKLNMPNMLSRVFENWFSLLR